MVVAPTRAATARPRRRGVGSVVGTAVGSEGAGVGGAERELGWLVGVDVGGWSARASGRSTAPSTTTMAATWGRRSGARGHGGRVGRGGRGVSEGVVGAG